MKIFVASFHRASDGALAHLINALKKRSMYTNHYPEADYILACGDRTETFDFVLEQFRKNKPIIHLWAGEISQGTHDEVYRHSITLCSMLQLCTNATAYNRVNKLCRTVDKRPNAYIVGNVMLDDLSVDETKVPDCPYNLVLYNPPTSLSREEVYKEIEQIQNVIDPIDIKPIDYIWIEPNGDTFSDIVFPYQNQKTLPREQFLGLLKNCRKFITNSSCQFYEAPFLIDQKQIISIGKRNTERGSKHANMSITSATDKIIRILKGLNK